MVTRFLDWYFTTDDPKIAVIRKLVRENTALRLTARALLGSVRVTAALPRRIVRSLRWTLFAVAHPHSALIILRTALRPSFNAKTCAIAGARSIGGALALAELEELWTAGGSCRRVLCVAAEPEFRQVAALLRARKPSVSIAWFDPKTKRVRGASSSNDYDLVVVGHGCDPDLRFADALDSGSVIWLGRSTPLSAWGYRSDFAAPNSNRQSGAPSADGLSSKLERGEPINVLLLSDIGFQYGAGIGLRRQTSSFLLNGWNVRVAAWTPGNATHQPPVTGLAAFENWQGVVSLSHLARASRLDDPIEVVSHEVEGWNPDVVITGNLHGTDWPLELLARLRSSERLLVGYMHDVYWATGRCAYPGTCTMFERGCTSACPTPHEYPRLIPERIPDAWAQRERLFRGSGGVPLVANSRWTQNIVKQRFGDAAHCEVVPLALDHHLFSPVPKAEARSLLQLPQDKTLIAMGAVDLKERRKGGPIFQALYKELTTREDIGVLLFGASSCEFEATKTFGLIEDERLLPLIYSAADIFVGTAVEEAFGQTLLEASACGLPVAAFNVGGVGDVVVHCETGLLVNQLGAEPMLAAIERLIVDSATREGLGRGGRRRVEDHFTLIHQARAWTACLTRLSESGRSTDDPMLGPHGGFREQPAR